MQPATELEVGELALSNSKSDQSQLEQDQHNNQHLNTLHKPVPDTSTGDLFQTSSAHLSTIFSEPWPSLTLGSIN